MFVVTTPARLDDVGPQLHEFALAALTSLGAQQARFLEYADDTRLIGFVEGLGYRESRRFTLDTGEKVIVLSRDLPA